MIAWAREARSRLIAWSQEETDTRWAFAQLRIHLRAILGVARANIYTLVNLHAQALALKTLLAVVPLLAVMFAIFKGFGGLQTVQGKVEEFLLRNLTGSAELRSMVRDHLLGFLNALDGEALGALSATILVFTVLSLLNNIENSIHAIFGVTTQRPWVRRFVMYWAVVTLGPLLLGASLTLTTALQIDSIRRTLQTLPGISQLVIGIAPLVITWLAFTAVYAIVPWVPVRLTSAFQSALIAGTVWNILKFIYAFYASNAVAVHTIYGSLAAIPLFILWVWLSWLCLLYGAQLAYAYDNPARVTDDHDEDLSLASAGWELAYARVFATIARDFRTGAGPTEEARLSGDLGVSTAVIKRVIETLTDRDLVNRVQPEGLVPSRDLSTVALSDVVNTFHWPAPRSVSDPVQKITTSSCTYDDSPEELRRDHARRCAALPENDALGRELETILERARDSSQRVLCALDYATLLERFPSRWSDGSCDTLAARPASVSGGDDPKR